MVFNFKVEAKLFDDRMDMDVREIKRLEILFAYYLLLIKHD